jgi:hypothetical protein
MRMKIHQLAVTAAVLLLALVGASPALAGPGRCRERGGADDIPGGARISEDAG